MAKSAELIAKKTARSSLMTYLSGEKTLDWAMGEIRYSGVRGKALVEIFDYLKNTHGETVRFRDVYSACKEQGWLD